MEVTVYGPLRAATGGKTVQLEPEGETVSDAVESFVAAYPRAESQLLTDDGEVRPSVRITVDGERAALEDACPAGASLQLFPAMQGG